VEIKKKGSAKDLTVYDKSGLGLVVRGGGKYPNKGKRVVVELKRCWGGKCAGFGKETSARDIGFGIEATCC